MSEQLTESKPKLSLTETREVLTPFAFKVDESLFGTPLAKSWKRAVAITVDLFLISLLSYTSGTFLAVVISITLFMLGSNKRAKLMGKVAGRRRRLFLRALAIIIVALTLFNKLPQVSTTFDTLTSEPTIESALVTSAESDTTSNDSIESNSVDATPIEETIVNNMKSLISNFGLGLGWAAFYFTAFTALWYGQTPGKKLVGIRVLQLDGTPLSTFDSFGRYGGYGAGLATGFMGFLQILWDPNRQAIQDKISSTVVVDDNAQVSEALIKAVNKGDVKAAN